MKTQGTISIIVGAIGFTTFTFLLVNSKIETLGYCSLLSLLTIVCIVIPVLGRLRELDLKNLKLTLEKIEQAKKEIYAKEKSLKESSHVLAELIAANSTLTGIWGTEESNSYSKALIKAKLRKLAEKLKFNSSEMDQIFKYEKALAEVHAAPKAEHDEKWNNFITLLKEESEKTA